MDSVTRWLELWREGDAEAMERVTALVYHDLRRLAASQDLRITPDQQFRLLDARGVDVRPE